MIYSSFKNPFISDFGQKLLLLQLFGSIINFSFKYIFSKYVFIHTPIFAT